MIHPYTSRPRLWARIFLIPFVIKKGKGAIIRRKARLDIIPSKKITLGIKSVIEDYAIINNGMGDITIGDYTHVTSRVKLVGPVTLGNYVTIGSGAQITGLTHNYLDVDRPIAKQGVSPNRTIIEDDVWIGGNSCINQGDYNWDTLCHSFWKCRYKICPFLLCRGRQPRPYIETI